MKSIAVIGGGIIGRVSALMLQQNGYQVTVFDDSRNLTAPSWNNAGHIALEQVTPLASYAAIKTAPKRLFLFGGALDFNLRDPGVTKWIWQYLNASSPKRFKIGSQALSELMGQADKAWEELAQRVSLPTIYTKAGHWLVWENARSTNRGVTAWKQANIGQASITPMDEEIASQIKQYSNVDIHGGLEFSGTGQIKDLPLLARTLKSRFLHAGGKWAFETISPLLLHERQVRLKAEDNKEFDIVLVCAGSASANLMRNIQPDIPLIAERGYHLESTCSQVDWPAETPPIVFEDRSMIVTRFTNTLRACSFVEFSSLNAPPDKRKWTQLLKHCKELGLPIGKDAQQWVGARPTLPDYLPAIGKSHCADNLYYAFGHQHLGLTLAAITGQKISDMINQNETPECLIPFSLERFSK